MKTAYLFIISLFAAAVCNAQGAYMEYQLTSESEMLNGLCKIYYQDGSSLSVISMSIPGMPGGVNISTLSRKEEPRKMYLLNEDKTYTELDLDKLGATSKEEEDFDIKVIGKEKLNGYNSTHVVIKSKTMPDGQDMWLSTDVPDYGKYKNINNKFTTAKLMKALSAKGVDGFPVRIKMSQQGQNIQLDMSKAEAKANPASMFSLDGYTKATSGSVQEMIQKMQEMSPEERQKMLDEMKQYGQPH